MSMIYYKFKSLYSKEFCLEFDSLDITVNYLKYLITMKHGINANLDILKVYDKSIYSDTDVIQRNMHVIVKRLPFNVRQQKAARRTYKNRAHRYWRLISLRKYA